MKKLSTASWSVLFLVLCHLRAAAIGGPDVVIVTAPLSQSVGSGSDVVFSVVATAPGAMQYQWRHGGKTLSGEKSSSLTLTNVQIADAGEYVVSIVGAGRTVNVPAAVLTVDGVAVQDVEGPRLTITSPPGTFVRSAAADLMVVGTATDDAGIAGICYKHNDADWVTLPSATNWMFNATLVPGTNVFLFKASDVVGNFSPTQRVVAYFAVTQQLNLTVVGGGQVVGGIHGQGLELGRQYTLKAIPSVGSYFSSWDVDGVISTNPTLNFVMSSNTTIVATFLGNPFIPLDGLYAGLFYDTNDPAHETSGFLTFKLTEQGRFTGKLTIAGESLALSGQFGMNLRAEQTLVRRLPNPPVTVELQLAPDSERVTGAVRNGAQSSSVEAYRSVFHAVLNPATNHAGKYTLVFSGGADPAASPSGHGHGAVAVSVAGLAQFKGVLADGVTVTHKVPLASNGQWPLYALLYKGQGSIFGWLTLADVNGSDVSGRLLWTKPAGASLAHYPSGFVSEVDAKGSRYTAPPTGVRALEVANGIVRLDGGNLAGASTNDVAIDVLNKVTVAPGGTSNLVVKLSASSGLISGSFTHPVTSKKTALKGAVLQRQNVGAGFFLGTNQGGSLFLGVPADYPVFQTTP